MVGKPHAPPPASNFSTKVIVSLVMLVLVITICVIIAFRHIKHSQKQQRRGRIQVRKSLDGKLYFNPMRFLFFRMNELMLIHLKKLRSWVMNMMLLN
jgi:hypothetical protein